MKFSLHGRQAFPDEIHIFYLQEENCYRKDGRTEEQRFWSREDTGIDEF